MGISAGPSGVSDGLVFQLDAANLRNIAIKVFTIDMYISTDTMS